MLVLPLTSTVFAAGLLALTPVALLSNTKVYNWWTNACIPLLSPGSARRRLADKRRKFLAEVARGQLSS